MRRKYKKGDVLLINGYIGCTDIDYKAKAEIIKRCNDPDYPNESIFSVRINGIASLNYIRWFHILGKYTLCKKCGVESIK